MSASNPAITFPQGKILQVGDIPLFGRKTVSLPVELTGNMPSSAAGYDYPALKETYPQELLDLFQESLEAAAPRTVSPYWSDISGALQARFHPPSSVDGDTPGEAQTFIEDVLKQEDLL